MASRKALLIIVAASMAVIMGSPLPTTATPDNHVVGEQKFWSGTNVREVGDIDGWTLGVNYDDWARANIPFLVGDALHFRYDPATHNVVQVNENGYDRCIVGNNARTWTGGDNFLELGDPGNFYFICGMGDHCTRGMKLAITVN